MNINIDLTLHCKVRTVSWNFFELQLKKKLKKAFFILKHKSLNKISIFINYIYTFKFF